MDVEADLCHVKLLFYFEITVNFFSQKICDETLRFKKIFMCFNEKILLSWKKFKRKCSQDKVSGKFFLFLSEPNSANQVFAIEVCEWAMFEIYILCFLYRAVFIYSLCILSTKSNLMLLFFVEVYFKLWLLLQIWLLWECCKLQIGFRADPQPLLRSLHFKELWWTMGKAYRKTCSIIILEYIL